MLTVDEVFVLGEFCVDKMCGEKSNSIDLKDYNI